MYRIAIVDDNEAWCYVLQTVLSQQNYDVLTFTDAYEFLNMAHRFDLALIDFSMPTRPFRKELDGSQVIKQLKHGLKAPPILVMCSSFFTEETLDIAKHLCPEADAYLSKSSNLTKIVNFVQAMTMHESQAHPVKPLAPGVHSAIH